MNIKEQLAQVAFKVTDDKRIAVKYAEHLEALISEIVPERIGQSYSEAIKAADMERACAALAAYYRAKPRNVLPDLSANGGYNKDAADRAIEGYAREVNIDWKFENGEIDYLFDPTAVLGGPINHEWLWQFNRHGIWGNYARTYVGTGDEKYALALEKQVLRWIAQTDIPEKWNAAGSAWRTIECGLRLLGSWQPSFDGLVRSDAVNDISIVLMISSMLKQAKHLVDHPTGRNWLMMEMNGVYTFSALFTELACSEEYRRIASDYLLKELVAQILPDGMHNELSPDYQLVVLNCAANFYSLATALGMKNEIPAEFETLIKDTVNAAVRLSTPAFTQPRTNDCYTILTNRFTERAEKLFGKDPVWSFVNTKRAEGHAPEGETASNYLPYAGFAVMRNGWDAESSYLCFDVGPLGAAHVHQDKLSINIFKGSEELIYDDGGGQYEISDARRYACSGYGHNAVLVDGLAQSRKGPAEVTEPIDASWTTNESFDYACGIYNDPFGGEAVTGVTHKREVRFEKPDIFVVKDTLSSVGEEKHSYELLFHLDTMAVKPYEGWKNAVCSDFGRKYDIAIIPLDCSCAEPELKTVSGQTEPMVQGWYNGRNESNLHKAITVSREVKGVKDYTFITLLIPYEAGGELPKVTRLDGGRVEIALNGSVTVIDTVNLDK